MDDKCVMCGEVIPEGRQVCISCEGNAIKDSGNRRKFETGAVRDIQEGKGRCDLLPLDVIGEMMGSKELRFIERFKQKGDIEDLYKVIMVFQNDYDDIGSEFEVEMVDNFTKMLEVSKHFVDGAFKYGENNWQKGIPIHCYIDSAVRHWFKFKRGDKDEPHDRAFIWNILCCAWTVKNKPELNDLRKDD